MPPVDGDGGEFGGVQHGRVGAFAESYDDFVGPRVTLPLVETKRRQMVSGVAVA